MRFSLFALISNLLACFCVFGNENAHYSHGALPAWVERYELPIALDTQDVSDESNVQYLLIDTQRNWEEKTLYRHFVMKALNQSGTEPISQVKINFDPSYSEVIVHSISVHRDGAVQERLENARHTLIQRESELEQNLYNGDLTLVYFLDDIREGDIVEYAYSLQGCFPLAAAKYTETAYLQRTFPVGKIIHRLVAKPHFSFSIKSVNTELLPKTREISPLLKEWVWEATETPAYTEERDQPIWYTSPSKVLMSQYTSWKDVATTILPLYSPTEDYSSQEMKNLVETWQKSSSDLSKQALLALRFVQDKIRYQGFEDGMGAFQPTNPKLTLERRFGDCKDKAFLLQALLKQLGISSKILLVDTMYGRTLPDILPTPFAFNHVTLEIQLSENFFYVDPTWSLQGGSLENTFFPDYDWALPLAESTSSLIPLPKQIVEKPTEIESLYTVINEDLAHLTIKSTFYRRGADRLRRSLAWQGMKKFSEIGLSEIQDFYGAASVNNTMELLDDRDGNVFTLIESYALPIRITKDRKELDILSHVLRSYLSPVGNPQRTSPYELYYPLWVKEKIKIENPFTAWTPSKNNVSAVHEAFRYSESSEFKNHEALFTFELKHLKDHIPVKSLSESSQALSEIYRRGLPTLLVSAPKNTFLSFNLLVSTSFIAIIMWVLFYLLSRKKRTTQDALSYHLHTANMFYFLFTLSPLFYYNVNFVVIMGVVLTFAVKLFSNFIFMKRSIAHTSALQVWILFQTFLVCFFFYGKITDVHQGHIFIAIGILALYATTILLALQKAKQYLRQEVFQTQITQITSPERGVLEKV